jgi:hypothetical protein
MDVRTILAGANRERLERAVCGLADGHYQIYLTQHDAKHVAGTVMIGDGKEYAVSICAGFVSCECRDFVYRHTTCKHVLALAVQVLHAGEVMEEEPEERPVNLKLTKTRPGWQACA